MDRDEAHTTTMVKSSGYSLASRSSSSSASSSTKTWLLKNLISMIGLMVVAFFVLVFSFESKMHKHTKLANEDLKSQHKLSTLRDGVSSLVKREIAKHQKAKVFNWKPIEDQCSARGLRIDPFPGNFDPVLYEENYGVGSDYHHYIEIGRKQGFEATRGQRMKEIVNTEILPKFIEAVRRDKGMVLEIGPFVNPMLVADDVKYFDVLDLEGLKERAARVGYPEVNPVNIDYVSPTGDLSVIPEREAFSLVASSNVLIHQVDLILHLQQVGELLKEGGYYAMTLADKRYMFDHHLAETSIAEILEDFFESREDAEFHKMRSVIEHRALTVHKDVTGHWSGQSGTPYSNTVVEQLQSAVAEYEQGIADRKYIDVHNYHFTPQSLPFLVDTIYNLGLTELRVHRLYETVNGQFEFGIVLKKCTPEPASQDQDGAGMFKDADAVKEA